MSIKIKINDKNWIEFEGTSHFMRYVLDLLFPMLQTKYAEDEIVNGRYSTEILLHEIELSKESALKGQYFKGKYVEYIHDESVKPD